MAFVLSAAYQWPKEGEKDSSTSEKAIKKIAKDISNYYANKSLIQNQPYKINYKRLRASAGGTMLDSIIKRIENSNAIIVDISNHNANVYIELGLAISLTKIRNNSISIYIIMEKVNSGDILLQIPSDIQGYFISQYELTKTGIVFRDNGSLRMSLINDIKEFYDSMTKPKDVIDEIYQK